MNRRLVSGVVAGVAAIALAAVGGTSANPVVSADVAPNTVGAGVLLLDLAGGDAAATLSFDGILPGDTSHQLVWVATNQAGSTVTGTLAITFDNLVDVAAPCAVSRDKALAEIDSGIGGCTVNGETTLGTPQQGNLSRLLAVGVSYSRAAAQAGDCTPAATNRTVLDDSEPGNLRADALNARPHLLRDGADPLRLAPGKGVCLDVTARWPASATSAADASPEHPTDNAAQGDSFTVDARFDLTQATR